MNRSTRRSNWPAFVIIALLLIAITRGSSADRGEPARPTAFATVDLDRVFSESNARREADARLIDLAKELEADAGRNAGNDADFVAKARRELGEQRSRSLTAIYEAIRTAAADLAKDRGYDLVAVNDTITPITVDSEAEARRQISARRLLYASETLDVTDALIERLNRAP